MENIKELRVTTGANPRKVKEFYKQLHYNVQSMNMREWLRVAKGNVQSTLGVRADLVRGNEGRRDWDFKDLLRKRKKNGQTSILSRKAWQKKFQWEEYQIQSKQYPRVCVLKPTMCLL